MSKITTHYDNLKVPRNAPDDVIRAAYKQLARRYHPDRNANSAESHRLMQSLNASFDVLDDPRRRAEHDQWIAAREKSFFPSLKVLFTRTGSPLKHRFVAEARHRPQPSYRRETSRWSEIFSAWIVPAGLVCLALWGILALRDPISNANPLPADPVVHPAPHAANVTYERPLTAPNGTPWPVDAAEIAGYPVDRDDGSSEVTVDNSRNAADVFGRLVNVDGADLTPVRYFYIPKLRSYCCQHVRQGTYEVWYQDLTTGAVKRSERFELAESKTERTTNYSMMRIILFRMSDGLSSAERDVGSPY